MSAFWETLRLLRKTHDTLVPESQKQRMTGKRGKEKEEAMDKEEKREMRSRTLPGQCVLFITVTYKREKLFLPNIFNNVTTIFIILILSCLSLLYCGKLYQLVWPMCKT